MAIPFLNNINLDDNQLLNAKLQVTGSVPAAEQGQIYFNSAILFLKPRVHDGADWLNLLDTTSILNGTYITSTVNNVDLTLDLSAVNGTAVAATRFLSKDNTWDVPAFPTGTLTMTTSTGLDGGTVMFSANQAGNTTFAVSLDLNELPAGGTLIATDSIIALNGTVGSKQLISAIPLSIFNNDLPTASDATITLISGNGLADGGSFNLNQAAPKQITFNVGGGDGIIANLNDIAADVDNTTIQITSAKIAAKTAAVANSGTALATGDQIYDFVTGQIANIPSGLSFEGSWNANTDSPDLSTATPDNGQFWIVSVAGTTDLDGIDEWAVGDWAIYVSTGAGTDGWQKVDNSSTLSGFGDTNQVTYWTSTGNVAGDAGFTFNPTSNNLTVGGTITSSGGNSGEWNNSYDNMITALNVAGTTTKTLTATQQDGGTLTASWTDNDSGGTVTNIATSGPITGGPITSTGTIGITTASSSAIGAGNVIAATADDLLGINVAYSGGTATVGLNIDTGLAEAAALPSAPSDIFIPYLDDPASKNYKVKASDLANQINSSTSKTGTIPIGDLDGTVTHAFGINTLVQTIDASGNTVFCDITRTATTSKATISEAQTAATGGIITILVQKIG